MAEDVRPATEAEIAEAVRVAPGPLRIVGGGTRSGAGTGAALHVSGLSGVTLYEPGALTLVALAGTPLAEVEAMLAAEGQRLPFEPTDLRGLLGRTGTPTLGGMIATNASGPRRLLAGACRDSLIGVRFVDGTGMVVKNGGRVMKNVTGYDLVKLLAGSHGTLGVLTEVSFKVLPMPRATATLRFEGLTDAGALQAMTQALGSPFEVSGAAHWPGRGTFLRIEGFPEQVAHRSASLERLLAGHGAAARMDAAETEALWRDIRDVAPFHGRAGDVWRLSVMPGDAALIGARTEAEALLYDWGGGLVWALVPEGTDLRARLGPFAGHATLVRAAPATHIARFQPEAAPLAALAAGLRARFDPRGILNPGLMA